LTKKEEGFIAAKIFASTMFLVSGVKGVRSTK